MITHKIKEVYLANQKIDVLKREKINAEIWRKEIVEDGLYIITSANDLIIYKLANYLFDVEKERGKEKYNLKFRERI